MYSLREIDIYISALEDARRAALETSKGKTAAHAITKMIQTTKMRKSVAIMKGRL